MVWPVEAHTAADTFIDQITTHSRPTVLTLALSASNACLVCITPATAKKVDAEGVMEKLPWDDHGSGAKAHQPSHDDTANLSTK